MENAYVANGVKFDGFKNTTLLEAKGPGYKNFVNKEGSFYSWFRGQDALVKQANRQVAAAQGMQIEWHIAEEKTMPAFEKVLEDAGVADIIKLIFTPAG